MNYKPKTAILTKMSLKTFFILLMLVWLVQAQAAGGVLTGEPYEGTILSPNDNTLNLPELGDTSQNVLSAQDERKIAEQILRQVATSDEVLHDVEITDYIQALGGKLAAAGPDKTQAFTFFVVKDNAINAFAMPGGVIGVHTGLFTASNSESELAGVLGHEIGHVTQHHLARMLEAQKNASLKNIAGIAAALLLARSNPQLATGAMTASTAYGIQNQLNYSREHEREADRVGLNILDQAGFDVRGMPAFFNTMQRNSRYSEGSAPSFLRTHPLTSERISDVSNRVQSLPYKQVVDSLDYALMRAKIKSMQGMAQAVVESFNDAISTKRYQNEVAEHYGLAYALLRKNDLKNALNQLDWINANARQHPSFLVLSAQIDIAQKRPQKAIETYTKGMKQFPKYRAFVFGLGEVLIATNQGGKAIQLLKEQLLNYPNDADMYELLAKAYSIEGKELLQHQAMAEAYYRIYDINRAVEQMELAAKANDGNFYEKSIVEARLKEFRRLQAIEKEARENA